MSNKTEPNLTLPEGITLPQQNPLASLLGGIGEGFKAGSDNALQQLLLQKKGQTEAAQKQERTNKLADIAGIDRAEVQGLDPVDLSQFIRSKAEEKKAAARQTAADTKAKESFAFQRAGKVLDRNEEIKEGLPILESSLGQMEVAINEGDLSFFSKDNLANVTGIEKFRSPEGALFLSAGKQFFFGTLKGVKGRANQLIEQTLLDALPKIGRDKNANLIVTRALRNEIELKKEKTRITDQLTDEFVAKGVAPPANFGSIISERMKPIIKQKQKELLQDFNKIKGTKQPPVQIRLPNGQPGTIPADKLEEALKLGAQQL